MVVQARQQDVGILRDRGFSVNQFGSSFTTALPKYSLKGKAKMKLRNKINRARGAGLDVAELGRELPKSALTFRHLNHISASWLAAKRKKELDFMIGEIGSPAEARRRIFVVRD